MHPYLMGDFPADPRPESEAPRPRKPYVAR